MNPHENGISGSRRHSRWMLLVVAVIGLAVLIGLDATLQRRFKAEIKANADLACQQFKQRIQDFFSVRFGALLALKSFYESSSAISSTQFQSFSAGLLKDIPYYRAIAFADYNFFIREVYPREGNQIMLGFSLKEPPPVYDPISRAIKEKRLTISSAINMRNVGIGLMANLPVFRNGRLFGVVIGVFDFNEIVEKSISKEALGQFYFRLLDPQKRIIYVGPGRFPSRFSAAPVAIGDSEWTLMLAPKKAGWAGLRLARQMLWFSGLVLLVGLLAFVFLLQRKSISLERANAQLKRANERIRDFETKKQDLLLQRMTDGVMLVDADTRITLANPSAARLLEKVKGKPWQQGDTVGTYWELCQVSMPAEKIFFSRDTVAFELLLKDESGVAFAGLATPLTDQEENRVGTVVTLRNITAEKRLGKLKSEFIGQISHKLLTPLAVLRENLGLLREGAAGALNAKQAGMAEKASAKSEELSGLIQRLLDFTQLENRTFRLDLKKESFYVEDFIRQALKELAPEIESKNIKLEETLMSGLTLHGGDSNRLKQMLVQVLDNAVKFNPPGTHVRLATGLHGGRVLIQISDDGVGIPPEELPHIFEPFYQIDGDFTGQVRGAGLGLSIAKQIAKAHNGDIVVESQAGKGSTFKIVLPYQ